MLLPLAAAAATIIGLLTLLWLVSLKRKDASLVDIFWGFGYVVCAWLYLTLTDGDPQRAWLITAMVTIWGLRLTVHLAVRNLGKGEDRRYAAMREEWGDRFWWVSYFTVFLFQGLLIVLISLPVLQAARSPEPRGLGWLDGLGLLVWGIGLFFEAVGDHQLRRFKADPDNRGKVLDTGVWRYTRHPNYFGDFCIWWGHFLVALATPGGLLTIVSPIIMSVFLMKISGVPMLEKDIAERRPGYRAYRERTSSFFPWPPSAGDSGRDA